MSALPQHPALIARLPAVRGRYRENAVLADTTWFRVGGCAQVLFKPEDTLDLADFLRHVPRDIPVTVLGVGSNLIVRDGGLDGVVIRLGRGFTDMRVEGDTLITGAANLDVNVAQYAQQQGKAGLEFLSGIPGGIGGALAMNAGAYGSEIKDVLISAQAVSPQGEVMHFGVDELHYRYRHCGLEPGYVFTQATFRVRRGDPSAIAKRMDEISAAREATQPVRERTGGSTFKNPTSDVGSAKKAWELIDAAGCRGMILGGAQVSPKHCNFLINTGNATAADIEALGEAVKDKVASHSGITLEWEIKRIGKPV